MAWRLGTRKSSAPMADSTSLSEDERKPLPAITRDFYLEHPDIAALTPEQVAAERERHSIAVQGDAVPNPVSRFVQASLPPYLLDTLLSAGYKEPTAIQRQAWPVAMSGRDLVGLAETGSGKTLAYLLPALVHVIAQPMLKEGEGPLALVLAPTRELAVQIHEEAVRFGHPCSIRTAAIYGGVPKVDQVALLRKAPEIVVATPGRLNDFLDKRKTELSRCVYLAVDEADRMLDLGFEPQLRSIFAHMRKDRQTLLFSATWPVEVQVLAERLLSPGHVLIDVGGALAASGRANQAIQQHVMLCEPESKLKRLVALLEELMDGSRLLVFASSRRRCDELTRELRIDGWPALAIHGDKPQDERDWVLEQFKRGEQPLLVATDVAQRGLDIKQVRAVINYDCPETSEAYVHRIGRTGRAGAAGAAYTLVTPEDKSMCPGLVKVLRGAKQPVPPEIQRLADEGEAAHRYKRYKYS